MSEPPEDVQAFLLEHPSLQLQPGTSKVRKGEPLTNPGPLRTFENLGPLKQ